MKKVAYALTFVAALLGGALAAHAGWVHTDPVSITDGELFGHAEASVAGARNSANNIEWFHCSAYDGYASCYFRDAEKQGGYCYTVDPYHVEAIKTVGAASYVRVEWRDSLGKYCRDVIVENGSEYVK